MIYFYHFAASIDLDGGENLNRKEIELREFREKYTRLEVEKNTLEMNQNSLLQEVLPNMSILL